MTTGLDKTVKPSNSIKEDTKEGKPSKYSILFHDDDITTKPFVVGVLKTHFLMSDAQAKSIMLQVHNKGIAKVGLFPSKEIAETKSCMIMSEARQKGFPFKVTYEKED